MLPLSTTVRIPGLVPADRGPRAARCHFRISQDRRPPVGRPQVIDDEERERVYEKVAAVDVAKDSGMVCTRLPHPSRAGTRQSTVWTVQARMGAIRELGRQLARGGIQTVTLESTSDYWRIWFFVLLRHEAPFDRMGVKGLCPWAVAAA